MFIRNDNVTKHCETQTRPKRSGAFRHMKEITSQIRPGGRSLFAEALQVTQVFSGITFNALEPKASVYSKVDDKMTTKFGDDAGKSQVIEKYWLFILFRNPCRPNTNTTPKA